MFAYSITDLKKSLQVKTQKRTRKK